MKEFMTGVFLGLVLTILLAIKVIAATPEETQMLVNTVYLEAGNQDMQGKRLVASVVLNRVDSEEFPDSISEVISQKGQFQTYASLTDAQPTWEDALAVQMELERRTNSEVIYFRAGKYGCGEPMFKHQDHYFSK